MTRDGLVCIPEDRPLDRSSRFVALFVLVTSALLIFGTTAIDLLAPSKMPRILGKELEIDTAKRANASFADGTRARLFEDDYRLTSRIRNTVGAPYARFLFRYLRESNSSVLLGDNGWMFIKDRTIVPEPPGGGLAERAAATEAAISRRLYGLGIRHVLIPIPRKAVIADKMLPYGILATPEFDNLVVPAMQARGVETVDLLPVYKRWEGAPLYLSMDSHWSHWGILLAGEAAIQKVGLTVPEEQRSTQFDMQMLPASQKPAGDLLAMIGVELDASDNLRYSSSMPEHLHFFPREGGPAPVQPTEPKSIVLCGTSFSQHSTLAYLLKHLTDRKVTNYATPGGSSINEITRALAASDPKNPPSVLFQEIPNHALFSYALEGDHWDVPAPAAELFALSPPSVSLPIPHPNSLLVAGGELGKSVSVHGQVYIGRLEENTLAHNGDGVLELEFEGQVSQEGARLVIVAGKARTAVLLRAGKNRVVMPILAQAPGADSIAIYLESAQAVQVRILQLRLVSALDKTTLQRFRTGKLLVDEDAGRWTQTLDFPSPRLLERFASIAIETSASAFEAKALEVSFLAQNGHQEFTFETLQPGGSLVLTPSLLEGGLLERVVLSGTLPAPPKFVREASLLNASAP